MIARQPVVDAALALLQAAAGTRPVRLITAPSPVPNRYHVLHVPPAAPGEDPGDQADPQRHLTIGFSIRSVARGSDLDELARFALADAHQLNEAFRDLAVPLQGDGWKAAGRFFVSTSGVEATGNLAEVVDDFELWVVPA